MSAQAEVLEAQCRGGQLDGHAIETRVRELWSSSQEFRAEFTSLGAALAYYKALSDGRVKQLVDQPGMVSGRPA